MNAPQSLQRKGTTSRLGTGYERLKFYLYDVLLRSPDNPKAATLQETNAKGNAPSPDNEYHGPRIPYYYWSQPKLSPEQEAMVATLVRRIGVNAAVDEVVSDRIGNTTPADSRQQTNRMLIQWGVLGAVVALLLWGSWAISPRLFVRVVVLTIYITIITGGTYYLARWRCRRWLVRLLIKHSTPPVLEAIPVVVNSPPRLMSRRLKVPVEQLPTESDSAYRARLVQGIQESVTQTMDSLTVGIDTKREISLFLDGVDLESLYESENTIESLAWVLQRVNEIADAGRTAVKGHAQDPMSAPKSGVFGVNPSKPMSRRLKILAVVSAVWLIAAASDATFSMQFFAMAGMLPVVIVWGLVWIFRKET